MNVAQHLSIFVIRVYQVTLSPLLGMACGPSARCRFTPTCSRYAMEAIRLHGFLAGGWLAGKRLCRCHPWGQSGEDHPPDARQKFSFAGRDIALRCPGRRSAPSLPRKNFVPHPYRPSRQVKAAEPQHCHGS